MRTLEHNLPFQLLDSVSVSGLKIQLSHLRSEQASCRLFSRGLYFVELKGLPSQPILVVFHQ